MGIPLFNSTDGAFDLSAIMEAKLNIASSAAGAAAASADPPSVAGAMSSSEDEDTVPAAKTTDPSLRPKRPPFDAKQIASKVKAMANEIFMESGSHLFTTDDLQEWETFAASSPTCLADVPADMRTVFEDFPPVSISEAPRASTSEWTQIELVEFKDPEKQGRGATGQRIARERLEKQKLKPADVHVGTFVLTVPHKDDTTGSSRLCQTQFNLARVVRHITPSAEADVGPLMEVWWTSCFMNGAPSSDVNGEWACLCKGQHQYTGSCSAGKCGGGVESGKWLATIALDEVVLANIKLKKNDGRLFVASAKAIARSSDIICAGTNKLLSFSDDTQKLLLTDK